MSGHGQRVERVLALCRQWAEAEPGRALSLHVAQHGRVVVEQGFGEVPVLANPSGPAIPVRPDTIFLVASLSKPVTALAVCLLVERGELLLEDPLHTYLPELADGPRHDILIRHLLTHTSGLPDMLPENIELRQAHSPLSVFVERACQTLLLFQPGTDCRYQSMGILLAATVVERISGLPLPVFLEREVFEPAGMVDTWLGGPVRQGERVARVRLSADEDQKDWTWNSRYWRELGAPWGGLHTTAPSYARLLQIMLGGGEPVLSPAMTRTMLMNQLPGMAGLSERAKRENGWGLGWRLNVPQGTHGMPEIGTPATFGHTGATGTAAWADPQSGLSCVILTNDPPQRALRSRLSNMAAGLAEAG